MSHRQRLGKTGEELACSYIKSLGYRIIERNFRVFHTELDIIALDGNTVVFIEVKTRTSADYGLPEEAVTKSKIRNIVTCAHLYLAKHTGISKNMRIDVIAIRMKSSESSGSIKHFKSVTL